MNQAQRRWGWAGLLVWGMLLCIITPARAQTFSPTGSMNTARANHTATLLINGKVLIAGGYNPTDGILRSAELYSPAAGLFTSTGSMSTTRQLHTATLLNNGKVLIAGGFNGLVAIATAEIYDPAGNGGAGSFTPTGSMTTGRYYHTATLLPNGKVLIAGGTSTTASTALATAELYDPVTGTFSASAASMSTTREYYTATLLNNGKVLMAGGTGNGSTALATAELYDPAGNSGVGSFTPTGSLITPRDLQVATLLPNGKVLITGGANGPAMSSAELYDPTTGTFTLTGSMSAARYGHSATLLNNGKVLVAGGYNGSFIAAAEIYDPATGTFTPTGSMSTSREFHTATQLRNGKVLVAGGYNGGYLATSELYNYSGPPVYITFIVTNVADSGPGSLREAILDSYPGDTVTFAANVTGQITLTTGELLISHDLTITGPGANILTVSGNNSSRVFDVTAGTVNISGLTIANGHSATYGGGIFNTGLLTVNACTVVNSSTDASGGGLYNALTLTVTNSTITENTAAFSGGGIVNDFDSALTLQNSTFSGNTANHGGGIFDRGYNAAITNCTISGNIVGARLINSGIVSPGIGGGLYAVNASQVRSCIIAGNTVSSGTAPDVNGAVSSNGYNLIGDGSGGTGFGAAGDHVGTAATPLNPRLGPLQYNGGPAQTMALLPGSPAIDAGLNSGAFATDQRGFPRTFDLPLVSNAAGGDATDIGAYELRPSDHNDFNGDGFPDLVLQNSTAQQVAFWFTNGPNITGGVYALSGPGPITLPPNWQVVGAGDFNGDGTPDLVLDNTTTGQIAFWFTSGNNIVSGAYATSAGKSIGVPAGWQIVGVGDFNGDGKPDLVLQNPSAQIAAIWTLNGTYVTSGAYVTTGGNPITVPTGWQIVGVGDFNADGHPDLVLDYTSTGQIAFWLANGSSITSGVYATYSGSNPLSLPSGWQIAGVGDYNGDGQTDLVLQNLNNRQIAFWYFTGTGLSGSSYALTGGNPINLPSGWQVNGPR